MSSTSLRAALVYIHRCIRQAYAHWDANRPACAGACLHHSRVMLRIAEMLRTFEEVSRDPP